MKVAASHVRANVTNKNALLKDKKKAYPRLGQVAASIAIHVRQSKKDKVLDIAMHAMQNVITTGDLPQEEQKNIKMDYVQIAEKKNKVHGETIVYRVQTSEAQNGKERIQGLVKNYVNIKSDNLRDTVFVKATLNFYLAKYAEQTKKLKLTMMTIINHLKLGFFVEPIIVNTTNCYMWNKNLIN
jgi:hypothetical protein